MGEPLAYARLRCASSLLFRVIANVHANLLFARSPDELRIVRLHSIEPGHLAPLVAVVALSHTSGAPAILVNISPAPIPFRDGKAKELESVAGFWVFKNAAVLSDC